jgi:hypothetical protein
MTNKAQRDVDNEDHVLSEISIGELTGQPGGDLNDGLTEEISELWSTSSALN